MDILHSKKDHSSLASKCSWTCYGLVTHPQMNSQSLDSDENFMSSLMYKLEFGSQFQQIHAVGKRSSVVSLGKGRTFEGEMP